MTAERKVELRVQGFRILDAVFQPEGHENPTLSHAAPADTGAKPSDGLKVEEIKAALAAKSIAIPDSVTLKADLAALLDAAPADAGNA
ncbi:hypothetical protein D3C85_1738230 [compost metagenome]